MQCRLPNRTTSSRTGAPSVGQTTGRFESGSATGRCLRGMFEGSGQEGIPAFPVRRRAGILAPQGEAVAFLRRRRQPLFAVDTEAHVQGRAVQEGMPVVQDVRRQEIDGRLPEQGGATRGPADIRHEGGKRQADQFAVDEARRMGEDRVATVQQGVDVPDARRMRIAAGQAFGAGIVGQTADVFGVLDVGRQRLHRWRQRRSLGAQHALDIRPHAGAAVAGQPAAVRIAQGGMDVELHVMRCGGHGISFK